MYGPHVCPDCGHEEIDWDYVSVFGCPNCRDDETEDHLSQDRLECWTTLQGATVCKECACLYTGSMPVALLPPRKCSECHRDIDDLYPME